MMLRGKYAEAAAELEQVLLIRTRVDGPTNHWVQETRYGLAEALFASGNFDRSRDLVDEAINISGTDPKQNVRALLLRTRAALAREQQRPADALLDLDQALQIATNLKGPRSHLAATLQVARAEALVALGRIEEARGLLADAALVLAETETDPRRPDQITLRLATAAADIAQGRAAAAHGTLVTLLDGLRILPRAEELWLLEERAQHRLGESLFALGRAVEGCRALDAAFAIRRGKSRETDSRLLAIDTLRRTRRCATGA
jgi:tetratricopeptide (TPR) repeat protein